MSEENIISRARLDELMREVFQELRAMGGKARPKELLDRLALRLRLTPYEMESTAGGKARWKTAIRWYTVDCSKAGYLGKSGGYWYLTAKGEEALKLPPGELIRTAQLVYRTWRRERPTQEPELEEPPGDEETVARQTAYEEAVESARTSIEEHLSLLGPYDFQELVAELLRGMGYHVPHVAPPGPDGGIDLVAYRDPLGTSTPRIKVQVKHRQSKVGAKDVRELEGLLRREGDIGLLVSSGGFSSDAEREARASHKHIELMDLDRLISLWDEHYASLRDSGRAMLRLVRVSFLAPENE